MTSVAETALRDPLSALQELLARPLVENIGQAVEHFPLATRSSPEAEYSPIFFCSYIHTQQRPSALLKGEALDNSPGTEILLSLAESASDFRFLTFLPM